MSCLSVWLDCVTSNCIEVITLNEYWREILGLITTLIGGGFLGNIIAGKNNTKVKEQNFIKLLQEERADINKELKEQDVKIDELYRLYRQSEERNQTLMNENKSLEWQLKREKAEKEQLVEENGVLKEKVENLEKRVGELEKERKV